MPTALKGIKKPMEKYWGLAWVTCIGMNILCTEFRYWHLFQQWKEIKIILFPYLLSPQVHISLGKTLSVCTFLISVSCVM